MNYFFLGISFIFLHELDAIRCKEWRIFPFTSFLNDEMGYKVFVFLHLPLFYWIFFQIAYNQPFSNFRHGFDIFLVIHLGLHILFLKHPKNEFKDWVSWSIIVLVAVFGGLDYFLT